MKLVVQDVNLTEKEIEVLILEYLAVKYPTALICNIEISGKPRRIGGKVIMIPFMSPFHRKGMPDILMWLNGKSFAFEVKKVSEYKWYKKKESWFRLTPLQQMPCKKKKHTKMQLDFINDIISNGGHGDFVCNISQVQEIIDEAFNVA